LSYIRFDCEVRLRPVPVRPRGILLMSVAARRSVAARWPLSPEGRKKAKRPGSNRNPGLSCEK